MAAIKILAPVVETAILLAPELLEIPVLGKILSAIAGANPLSETQALDELQKLGDEEKKTRQKEIDENGKHVIKVSDALTCVQKTTLSPKVVITLARGLIKALSGGSSEGFTSIMYKDISECIIANRLRQDTPRTGTKTVRNPRPAKGHGEGRKSF